MRMRIGPMVTGRSPTKNDIRSVFVKVHHPRTFWGAHKKVCNAKDAWFAHMRGSGIRREASFPAEKVDQFIQVFVNGVAEKVYSNQQEYSKTAKQNEDSRIVLEESIPPDDFGDYLKYQIKDAIHNFLQLLTPDDLTKLFTFIEIELDLN